jgi:hypothetical protein
MQVQDSQLDWVGANESDASQGASLLCSGELNGSTLVVLVSSVAMKIFKSNLFFNIFIAATCYFGTRLAKKLFVGYALFHSLEKEAIEATRTIPYLKPIATVAACIFTTYVPILGMCSAAALGMLAGLTYQMESTVKTIKT